MWPPAAQYKLKGCGLDAPSVSRHVDNAPYARSLESPQPLPWGHPNWRSPNLIPITYTS